MLLSKSAARRFVAAFAIVAVSCSGASSESPVGASRPIEVTPTSTVIAAPSSPSPAPPSGPFSASMTFDNTQTGSNGECRGVPQATSAAHITGSGTWTATRRASGGYDLVAEYASGARNAGTLDSAKRQAALESSSTSPSQTSRTISTQRFNEDYTHSEGEAQLVVTLSSGGSCTVTYALTSTFASPLLPPDAR